MAPQNFLNRKLVGLQDINSPTAAPEVKRLGVAWHGQRIRNLRRIPKSLKPVFFPVPSSESAETTQDISQSLSRVEDQTLPIEREAGFREAARKRDDPLEPKPPYIGLRRLKQLYLIEVSVTRSGPERMNKRVRRLGAKSKRIHAGLGRLKSLTALLAARKATNQRTIRYRPENNLTIAAR
jgi:hypothetical protein